MTDEELKQAIEELNDAKAEQRMTDEEFKALAEAYGKKETEQKPVAYMYTSPWMGNKRFFTYYQTDLSTYKADKVWPLYTLPPQHNPCLDVDFGAVYEAYGKKETVQALVGVEWTPCIKRPHVVVHVRQQHLGETHVSTREGITPAKPDDLIMRGVEGEEYPIGRVLFLKTYTFDTSTPQRQPLTVNEVWQNDQVMSLNAELGCNMDLLMEVIKAVEAAHGIGDKT